MKRVCWFNSINFWQVVLLIVLLALSNVAVAKEDISELQSKKMDYNSKYENNSIAKISPSVQESVNTQTLCSAYIDENIECNDYEWFNGLIGIILVCVMIALIIALSYVLVLLGRNKRITKELNEKQKLLADRELEMILSLEAAGIGVVKYNIETKQYYRDESFYEYLGYSLEDQSNFEMGIFNIIYEEDVPIVNKYLEELGDSKIEDKYSITVRVYKKDRSLATVLLLGKVTEFTEDNMPKMIHGVIIDVTFKNKIESENQRLIEFLKLALSEYRMSTWEWNRKGDVVNYHFLPSDNPLYTLAERKYNHSGDELTTKSGWYNEYLHPDDIEIKKKFNHKYQSMTIDNKSKKVNVHQRVIIDDNVFQLYLHAKAIEFGEDGVVSKVIGIVLDVTEIVKEEENKAQSKKLEAIGTLAGGIAHDFNNQLNGILGFVDLLQKMEEIKNIELAQKYIKIISDCGKRCEGLTSQLQAFARKSRENQEDFDIHLSIDNMVEMLEHIVDKSISITVELGALIHTFNGDKNLIENSLLNVIINACDAMDNGGSIKIETDNDIVKYIDKIPLFRKYINQQAIIIKISDTGKGIERDALQKIFEPFFTTKDVGKGTGMGLAVVFGVIKEHAGEIYVESSVGIGTTFYICLPTRGKVSKLDVDEKDINNWHFNNKLFGKILVVDDEMSVRILLKNYLISFGCEVLLAANGEEAVEIYSTMKDEISLVISDISMPKMSGPEALIKLKEIDDKVKVILITGYAENDEKVVFMLKNGASDLLKKPLNREKLYMAIRKVLEQ